MVDAIEVRSAAKAMYGVVVEGPDDLAILPDGGKNNAEMHSDKQ